VPMRTRRTTLLDPRVRRNRGKHDLTRPPNPSGRSFSRDLTTPPRPQVQHHSLPQSRPGTANTTTHRERFNQHEPLAAMHPAKTWRRTVLISVNARFAASATRVLGSSNSIFVESSKSVMACTSLGNVSQRRVPTRACRDRSLTSDTGSLTRSGSDARYARLTYALENNQTEHDRAYNPKVRRLQLGDRHREAKISSTQRRTTARVPCRERNTRVATAALRTGFTPYRTP
jgi:hypothetical protein